MVRHGKVQKYIAGSRFLIKSLRLNEIKFVTIKKYWKCRGGTAVFLKWKSTEKSTKVLNFSTLLLTTICI